VLLDIIGSWLITNLSGIKKNTNHKNEIKISINDILNIQNNDTIVYRDIFRFMLPNIKKLLSEFIEKEESEPVGSLSFEGLLGTEYNIESNTSFRIRELINWLRDNNRELKEEFHLSHYTKSNFAQAKTPYITNRIEKLVELGLLVKEKEKVESDRNRALLTDIYDITGNGVIVALTLDLHRLDRRSNENNKLLKFLLKEWLSHIPKGYKDFSNYQYYFIESLLENCIEKYDDTLLYFFSLIQGYPSVFRTDFSELRFNLNNAFYKKIIVDDEFKTIFYKELHDFNFLRHVKVSSKADVEEGFLLQKQRLLKFQFKLDVETQIERNFSDVLKSDLLSMKLSQWSKRTDNMGKTMGEVYEHNNYTNINKEIVLDFEIKNDWEQERNQNLINFDKIVLIMKCDKCSQIYPYPFEIEKEYFNEIMCKYCKGNTVKYYGF